MSKPLSENKNLEIATLAGGCFWCTEAAFSIIKGVERIEPGYTGGLVDNPSYDEVSTGTTGHAEAAQIFYDPKIISYKEILEIFFTMHDPTTLNRQGADVGTQYRSAIFYSTPEQKAIAEKLIEELTKEEIWNKPIVTKVEPLKVFYNAETYHKDYYKKHPKEPYCQAVIAPKIAKLQAHFIDKIKVPLWHPKLKWTMLMRFLRQIEGASDKNFLPIIGPFKGKYLGEEVRKAKPQRVLEVGTLIGYSTILMGKEMEGKSEIVTIEIHRDEAELAEKNIVRSNIPPKVKIITGDALEVIPTLEGQFDFAFIDARKTNISSTSS